MTALTFYQRIPNWLRQGEEESEGRGIRRLIHKVVVNILALQCFVFAEDAAVCLGALSWTKNCPSGVPDLIWLGKKPFSLKRCLCPFKP